MLIHELAASSAATRSGCVAPQVDTWVTLGIVVCQLEVRFARTLFRVACCAVGGPWMGLVVISAVFHWSALVVRVG